MTGYQMEELVKMKIWDLMSGNRSRLSNGQVEALWNNGIPVKTFSTLLKHKNGLPVQVEVNLETVITNKTKVFRANIENITLRKKVFKTLQKRNADYKRLMSRKSDFKYGLALDGDGKPYFTWLSHGFQNVTGYQPEEYTTAASWGALVHPDDVERVSGYLKKVLLGRSACTEYRIKTSDGPFRRVLDYAKVDESDDKAIRGSIVDITLTRVK